MKKYTFLIIIMILLITTSIYSKKKKKDKQTIELTSEDMQIIDNTTLQKIIEVDMSKEDIYTNLVEWINKNFISKDTFNMVKDKEKGLITGIGNALLYIENDDGKYSINYIFKYIFEIKDKKIRFTMKEIYFYQIHTSPNAPDTEHKRFLSGEAELKFMSKLFTKNNFLDKIKDGIEKKNADW